MSYLVFGLLLLILLYLSVAAILTRWEVPAVWAGKGLTGFSALYKIDYSTLPDYSFYRASDGAELAYYHYRSSSDNLLILLHGAAASGKYWHPMAQYISSQGIADVIVPDLRGHAKSTVLRWDVAYVGQLEDDLSDLVRHLSEQSSHRKGKLYLTGHSSGGGLIMRYLGSEQQPIPDGVVLLSPFMGYDSPTYLSGAGGWARTNHHRIWGIKLWNLIGVKRFNQMTVVDFNLPKAIKERAESICYTFRISESMGPHFPYWRDIRKMKLPTLVLVGEKDEAFNVSAYSSVFAKYQPSAQVVMLPEITHLRIVTDRQTAEQVGQWIKSGNAAT